MRIQPKAVILDYGNLLSSAQPADAIVRMAGLLDLARDRFVERYWQFRVAYDEAALDPAAYWSSVADRPAAGFPLEALLDIDAASWSHPAPSVPAWARRVREAGYRTALLSNMPASVRDRILVSAWLPPFDHRTFSCDLRISKPAPGMYMHALDGLKVAPEETLFLDDRAENIRAALALGMHGVQFTTLNETAAELERRFDIPALLAATL
jgi:putative hydrolase of the HAD superfamily